MSVVRSKDESRGAAGSGGRSVIRRIAAIPAVGAARLHGPVLCPGSLICGRVAAATVSPAGSVAMLRPVRCIGCLSSDRCATHGVSLDDG
jgi:hypothetical protein